MIISRKTYQQKTERMDHMKKAHLSILFRMSVCIILAVATVFCSSTLGFADFIVEEDRGQVTVIETKPDVQTEEEDDSSAPYSPKEMMDLGISTADELWISLYASYPSYTSSQIALSSGKWIVKATGTILNKWVIVDGNYRYYANGILQTGWKELPIDNTTTTNKRWYYFGADGNMRTGWIKVNNDYFYLFPTSGAMASAEWVQYENDWYYFNSDGYMCRKWLTVSGKTYYLREKAISSHPDGSMVIGVENCLISNTSTKQRPFYFGYDGVWYKFDHYVLPDDAVLITDEFGGGHQGLDLKKTDKSTEALTIYAGTPAVIKRKIVSTSDNNYASTGFGIVLESNIPSAENSKILTVRYFHMKDPPSNSLPSVGGTVTASTVLGQTGTTGESNGVHLHIDISPLTWGSGHVTEYNAYNPVAFLFPQGGDFNPSVISER